MRFPHVIPVALVPSLPRSAWQRPLRRSASRVALAQEAEPPPSRTGRSRRHDDRRWNFSYFRRPEPYPIAHVSRCVHESEKLA